MKKPWIALLTDFGAVDVYAGLLKAVIAGICPEAGTIDLCHGIEPQNILQGAVMLEKAYSDFPEGTVFVCVVDPGVGTGRKIIAVKTKHYYFVAPDNGLLAPVLSRQKIVQIRSLENRKFFRKGDVSFTFHGRDILSPAGAHLAKSCGKVFSQLGPVLRKIQPLMLPKIQKMRCEIQGSILYFDYYGNAMTNILRGDAPETFWSRVQGQVKGRKLGGIRRNYQEGKGGALLLFNSFSRLEIAWPGGSAKHQLKLKAGDPVSVKIR